MLALLFKLEAFFRMLKLFKVNMNPCAVLLAAGLLMMVSSAFSIELVSAATVLISQISIWQLK